eukprot:446614_1
MDTDKIGSLIKFMKITNKFNTIQYNELLSKMTTSLPIEFMKKLIFYGFYSLLTINNKDSDTNINTLNNVIQTAMKMSNVIHNYDAKLPNLKLQSLNLISLQQLCNNRKISIHNNRNNKS